MKTVHFRHPPRRIVKGNEEKIHTRLQAIDNTSDARQSVELGQSGQGHMND